VTTFEVAAFICCKNIKEFYPKFGDKPKWENPVFLEILTLSLDSQIQCLLSGASTGIPGDANCVSKITGGTKFDAQGGQI